MRIRTDRGQSTTRGSVDRVSRQMWACDRRTPESADRESGSFNMTERMPERSLPFAMCQNQNPRPSGYEPDTLDIGSSRRVPDCAPNQPFQPLTLACRDGPWRAIRCRPVEQAVERPLNYGQKPDPPSPRTRVRFKSSTVRIVSTPPGRAKGPKRRRKGRSRARARARPEPRGVGRSQSSDRAENP